MKCPGCKRNLRKEKYESTIVDRCTGCGGVWLDEGEIVSILKDVSKEFSEELKIKAFQTNASGLSSASNVPANLPCPKCNVSLDTYQYALNSGVYIDRCQNKHGLWLDAGELEKIQIIYERGLMAKGAHPRQNEPGKEVLSKKCPIDGSLLTEIQYEGSDIDLCRKCGGTWLHSDELKSILETREKRINPKEVGIDPSQKTVHPKMLFSALNCIDCGKPMKRSNYSYQSGIIIDTCTDGHGVWLDHHELERLQAYFEHWQDKSEELEKKYSHILRSTAEQATSNFLAELKKGENTQDVSIKDFLSKIEW